MSNSGRVRRSYAYVGGLRLKSADGGIGAITISKQAKSTYRGSRFAESVMLIRSKVVIEVDAHGVDAQNFGHDV